MKSIQNISFSFAIILLIGVLLSVSMLKCIGFSSLPFPADKKEIVKKEKNENAETPNQAVIQKVSMEAVIPFLTVVIYQELYIIFHRTFINPHFTIDFTEPLYVSKYFKNLFLFVISVNAP